MTIPASEPKKITAPGNGVATVFSFAPMNIFQASDLQVTRVDAFGIETLLTQGTGANQYLVTSPITFPGTAVTGSITFPSTGDPLPLNESLIMKTVLPIEQQTDLENQGGYFPEIQETQFDKGIKIEVQQQEVIDRTVRLPISTMGVNVVLPIPIADRVLGWDATASNLVNKAAPGTLTTTAFSESFLDDSIPEEGRDTLWSDTVKGDVIVSLGGSSVRLPVGTNGQRLTANSAQPSGTEWSDVLPIIPAGSKMLFQQTTAPVGWTKDTVHNDKGLRVVSGAAGSGGTDPFSTTFGGAGTTGSHVLTQSELASHKHFSYNVDGSVGSLTASNQPAVNGVFSGDPAYVTAGTATAATIGLTSATGGDTGHTHTMTLDLQFVDLIIATKD